MTESSIAIIHQNWEKEDTTPHILDFQKGYSAHVEFDFLKIWKNLKKRRAEDIIGLHFVHVHPKGFGVGMSATDVNCLEGFVKSFGISPLFSIIEFTDSDLRYKQASYEIQMNKVLTLTEFAKPDIPIWAVNILWNLATQDYFPLNYDQKEK